MLPPIVDPFLYSLLACVGYNSHNSWFEYHPSHEFVGDRIYNFCVIRLTQFLRLPRQVVSTFFTLVTSNSYQEALYTKYFVDIYSSKNQLSGKGAANAVEVVHVGLKIHILIEVRFTAPWAVKILFMVSPRHLLSMNSSAFFVTSPFHF